MSKLQLKAMDIRIMRVQIVGVSSLIQHKWSEKAKEQMREKHAGRKTKTREARDPEGEAVAATYICADGRYGMPAGAIRKCLIGAAHKDLGIEKTLTRKSFFIMTDDPDGLVPMVTSGPKLREDYVSVGMGTDLRYRPEFMDWAIPLTIEFDAEMLTPSDILTLFDRAGFGVGLMEWRPERDGDHGRFRIDTSVEVTVSAKPPVEYRVLEGAA